MRILILSIDIVLTKGSLMNKALFSTAVLVAALASGAAMAGGGGSGSKGGGQGGTQGGGYGQMTQQKSNQPVKQSNGTALESQEQERLRLEQHEGAKQMEGDHDALKTQTQDRQQLKYDSGSQK
jgi:hypothetical protein